MHFNQSLAYVNIEFAGMNVLLITSYIYTRDLQSFSQLRSQLLPYSLSSCKLGFTIGKSMYIDYLFLINSL